MARLSKSEHGEVTPATSFKLSDKHRFALHLIARQRSLNYTQVLEEAIEELASKGVGLPSHWLDLFDVEPAVAYVNLYGQPGYKPSPKESELVALMRAHPEFWWKDTAQKVAHRAFAVVLWPHRETFVKLWRKRGTDYYVAARAMAEALKKAKLTPPKVGDDDRVRTAHEKVREVHGKTFSRLAKDDQA